MSMTYGGDQITFNDNSTQNTSATGFGFKNRIINGAMMIDQRNAGASVTANGASYTLDRWQSVASSNSVFSVQQNAGSVTPPAGFKNYLGVTSLAATSVGTSSYFLIVQPIEGYNVADFGLGTASASTFTISFWVRSSLTGSFGGVIANSADSRTYPISYSISSANTWEQKSITVAGDTTGTWLTTNGTGLKLILSMGSGSNNVGTANTWASTGYNGTSGQVNVVGTNGATLYITGVQLEKGSTATSFDYRPYSTELALCQRYYLKVGPSGSSGYAKVAFGLGTGSSSSPMYVPTPASMRGTPSIAQSGCATSIGSANTSVSSITVNGLNQNGVDITVVAGTYSTGQAVCLQGNANTNAYLELSAEL